MRLIIIGLLIVAFACSMALEAQAGPLRKRQRRAIPPIPPSTVTVKANGGVEFYPWSVVTPRSVGASVLTKETRLIPGTKYRVPIVFKFKDKPSETRWTFLKHGTYECWDIPEWVDEKFGAKRDQLVYENPGTGPDSGGLLIAEKAEWPPLTKETEVEPGRWYDTGLRVDPPMYTKKDFLNPPQPPGFVPEWMIAKISAANPPAEKGELRGAGAHVSRTGPKGEVLIRSLGGGQRDIRLFIQGQGEKEPDLFDPVPPCLGDRS